MPGETSPSIETRIGARWQRIPRLVRVGVVVVLVGGASFSVTILPFITANRSTTTVEIAGSLPTTGVLGQATSYDVAADDTGDGDVEPICVKLTAQPPVNHLTAVFQGLDYVHAVGDLLCGGELSGSETVSIHLAFTPTVAGITSLRMVAAQGKDEIGPARTWSVVVAGPSAR